MHRNKTETRNASSSLLAKISTASPEEICGRGMEARLLPVGFLIEEEREKNTQIMRLCPKQVNVMQYVRQHIDSPETSEDIHDKYLCVL